MREVNYVFASSFVDDRLKVFGTKYNVLVWFRESKKNLEMGLGQHLLVCNAITCDRQPMNGLDIDNLVHAILLERWRSGSMVGSSGIYKCRSASCREEFAFGTLTGGGSINVAPDP